MSKHSDHIYKAVLYCRVAHEDQLSLERQEESLRVYAKENGYPHPVSYLDNGYSGLNFDRPAFMALCKDIQAGKVSTVIVRDENRIGRNLFEVENWIDGVERKGVTIIAANGSRTHSSPCGIDQAIKKAMRSYRGSRSNKRNNGKVVST